MANKKLKIIQKQEISKAIDVLSREYWNRLNDNYTKYIESRAWLNDGKITKSEAYSKKTYKSQKKSIKKWYEREKKSIYKENIISVNKQQYDDFCAKRCLSLPPFKRWFFQFFLTSDQKSVYKKMLNKMNSSLNEPKTNFDSSNAFEVKNFNFYYGQVQALFDINMNIKRNTVTAFIGPSGCGKSTFLRCLNRMNDQFPNIRVDGFIHFVGGVNVYSKQISKQKLTTKIGMIFQKATPFPMSIYDNVAYGPRSHGVTNKIILDQIVEDALKSAALWDEVKDKLFTSASSLSGGQQQRLCIARAIALKPEVLLMDESTSALDPITTSKIENLICKLKDNYTIILVSHSLSQVQRVSDYTAFFHKGELVEFGTTKDVFTNPKHRRTKNYISGKIS